MVLKVEMSPRRWMEIGKTDRFCFGYEAQAVYITEATQNLAGICRELQTSVLILDSQLYQATPRFIGVLLQQSI